MLDNTLVRALLKQGVDAQLIPTYTPIRTDEEDVSVDRVFFGGINVYLQQKIPLFRHLPAFADRFLDRPWLIRRMTSRAATIDAKQLGALTVSMLRGAGGYQRKEVRRLCSWLSRSLKPDVVHLSNILIGGCVPTLKQSLDAPVFVTLQGDDIFLESLPDPHKGRALEEIRRLVSHVDGFIVHSRYYAEFMSDYFSIPSEKMHVLPLSIDISDFPQPETDSQGLRNGEAPTIGYLARLAPEKGLHLLVDAFIELRERSGMENAQLRIAGWLGKQNQDYADAQFQKLRDAGLDDAFQYAGAVDRQEKVDFLRGVDLLAVPTVYREPKGIFVLEALASGVPVVQPRHGAFPELLDATGGGRLVQPDDPKSLVDAMHELLTDHDERLRLARTGCDNVRQKLTADVMANKALNIYRQHLDRLKRT